MKSWNKKYILCVLIILPATSIYAMHSGVHQLAQPNRALAHAARRLDFRPSPLSPITGIANEFDSEIIQPIKQRRIEKIEEQQAENPDSTHKVFSSPDLLTNILKYLNGSDFSRFSRICKPCADASRSIIARELLVADMLLKQEKTPIRFVLDNAHGQEFVDLCGTRCLTKNIVRALREKGTLLDESIGDFNTVTFLCEADRQGIVVSQTVAQELSPDEMVALLPVKYLAIDYHDEFNANGIHEDGVTEKQVIEQIENAVKEYQGHTIALELFSSNDVKGKITESLINKLAKYPIISLYCDEQEFPHGLACLSALHQLRGLSITDCDILEDSTICDQLCKELPFLTVLQIVDSDLTSISASIEMLKHLSALAIYNSRITQLPQGLRNLQHIKVLHLWQQNLFSAQNVAQCLPTHGLQCLYLSKIDPNTNPLPASCDVQQLQNLALNGSLQPLISHKDQLKNLQNLLLFSHEVPIVLPHCITELPRLQEIGGQLHNDTTVCYQTLLGIARKVQSCTLFTPHNALKEINEVAALWQFIQTNYALLANKLDAELVNLWDEYSEEIVTLDLLFNTTLSVNELRNLLENAEKISSCEDFIRYILISNDLSSGAKEAREISQQIRPNDATFAMTLRRLSWALCGDVTVYQPQERDMNNSFLRQLRDLACTIDTMIRIIDQGIAISDEQFRQLDAQLKLCAHKEVKYCTRIIANLLFHHAIDRNDITNAAIILKHTADINSALYNTRRDTPLHIAITNRESTSDENLKQRIDHVICFLIKNGAQLTKRNRDNLTPLKLIPLDSSLNEKIKYWRTS